MKNLFSLKSRIGAILTAAALVSTALPMTGFAATATQPVNLLANPDFNSQMTVGEGGMTVISSADNTSKLTIAAGTVLPTDWNIEFDGTADDDTPRIGYGGGNYKPLAMSNANTLKVTQVVKNIKPNTSYSFSYGAAGWGSNHTTAQVVFGRYDEENGFQTITDYITKYNADKEDADKLVTHRYHKITGSDYEADDTVSYSRQINSFSQWNLSLYPRTSVDFITPPLANAVKVVIFNNSEPNSSHSHNFDFCVLAENTEVVNDGNFDAKSATDSDGSLYLSGWNQSIGVYDEDGVNIVAKLDSGNNHRPHQNIALKASTKYRVTFKYKDDLTHENATHAPYLHFSTQDGSLAFVVNETNAFKVGTDGDWDLYEGYFTTVGASNNNTGLPIHNYQMMLRTRNEANWSGAQYYDNLSIVEATKMGVTSAGGAEIVYSPAYDGETVELIVAKYEPGTTNLVDIDRETIGADAKAGYVTKYVASMAASYDIKAFLWDGLGTMKPLAAPVTRSSMVREVPYFNDFSSADDVARVSYQDISIREKGGSVDSNAFRTGTIGIEDGKLVQRNVTGYWFPTTPAFPYYLPARNCGNGQLTIDFEPQSTGTLVLEVYRGYTADVASNDRNIGGFDGMFGVYASDGTRIAGIQADGRGDFGSPWEKTKWVDGTLDGNNWMNARTIKYEIDFTAKKYKVFFDNVQKTAGTQTEFEFTQSDASKLVYNFSQNGEAIDNIRIYKKVTAEQAETAFTLNVGDTASAAITYTPATESMFDMTYASSNTAIAEVTANGLITAKRAGTATITATSEMYGTNLAWTVTVPDTKTIVPAQLPYIEEFDTADLEIKDMSAWKVLNRQANAVLKTADGKLVATGVAKYEKATGAVQAEFDIVPTKGKIVIETSYANLNREVKVVAAADTLFSFYDSNGQLMGGIQADGRGGGRVYTSGAWVNAALANWLWGGRIKYVIDTVAGSYQVYQNDVLISTSANAEDNIFWLPGDDVASIKFTFTNEGDYLDYIKVYVPEDETPEAPIE